MLPLCPPKVNVGCWTRELGMGFQNPSILNTDHAAYRTRTGMLAQPLVLGIRTLIRLP